MATEIATLTQTPATTLSQFNNNSNWIEPLAIGHNSSLSLNAYQNTKQTNPSVKTSSTLTHYNAIFSDDDDDDSPPQVLSSYLTAKDKHPLSPPPVSSKHLNRNLNARKAAAITPTNTVDAGGDYAYQSWSRATDSALKNATSYHTHQADTALKTLKRIILEDDWKKVLKHKSGVVVHMKNRTDKDDKTPIFKGEAVIQGFSPQSIFYVVGMRKLWDEQYEDGNLIENLNDTTSLTYEAMKPTATNKSRDLALVEKIECTQNGAIIFACTSVVTPRIPKVNGRTRANIKLQGWILEPLYGGPRPATRVIYVIQENMKGWMPGFAKKTLARRPLVIAKVAEYLEKKTNRIRAQQQQQQNKSGSPSTFFQSLTGGRNRRPSIISSSSNSNPLVPPLPSPLFNTSSSTRYNSSTGVSLHSSQQTSDINSPPQQHSRKGSASHQQQLQQQAPSNRINSVLIHTLPASNTTDQRHISFAPQPVTYSINSNSSQQQTNDNDNMNSGSDHSLNTVTDIAEADFMQNIVSKSTTPQAKQSTSGLYVPHRHPIQKVESLQLLKRLSLTTDDWSLSKELENGSRQYVFNSHIPSSEEEDDLTSLIHDYATSDSDLPNTTGATAIYSRSTRRLSFIRVDGIIEGKWTAEQLCTVVHNFGARKLWDSSFEGARTIDRFSQKDYLEEWNLKHATTNAITALPSLDLAVITSLETDPVTGTVYAASTSVEDTQIPPPHNKDISHRRIRAHTDLYGWVFRPHSDKNRSPTDSNSTGTSSIHVSFICNMNFNYHFPNPVLQEWIEASYQSINRLKSYLSDYGCPPYIRRVAGKVVSEEFDPITRQYHIRFIAKHQPSNSYRQRKERQYQQQGRRSNNNSSNKQSTTTALWCTDIRFDRQMYPDGVDISTTPTSFTHIQVSTKNQKSVKIFTTDGAVEGEEVTFSMQPLKPIVDSSFEHDLDVLSHTRYMYNGVLLSGAKQQKANSNTIATVTEQADDTTMSSTTKKALINENSTKSTLSQLQAHPNNASISELKSIVEVKENEKDGFLPQHQDSESLTEKPLLSSTQTEPNNKRNAVKEPFDSMKIPKGYVLVPEHQNNNIIVITDELSFNGQQLSLIFLAMVLCYYMGKFSSCTATSY